MAGNGRVDLAQTKRAIIQAIEMVKGNSVIESGHIVLELMDMVKAIEEIEGVYRGLDERKVGTMAGHGQVDLAQSRRAIIRAISLIADNPVIKPGAIVSGLEDVVRAIDQVEGVCGEFANREAGTMVGNGRVDLAQSKRAIIQAIALIKGNPAINPGAIVPGLEDAVREIDRVEGVYRELDAVKEIIISPVVTRIERLGKQGTRWGLISAAIGALSIILGFGIGQTDFFSGSRSAPPVSLTGFQSAPAVSLATDPHEPNNTPDAASPLDPQAREGKIDAIIDGQGDADYYRLTITRRSNLSLALIPGAGSDLELFLLDRNKELVKVTTAFASGLAGDTILKSSTPAYSASTHPSGAFEHIYAIGLPPEQYYIKVAPHQSGTVEKTPYQLPYRLTDTL